MTAKECRRKAEERPRPSPPPPTATLCSNSGISRLLRQPPLPFSSCDRHSPVLTALGPQSLVSLGIS
ncbi:UNVERIFIED_CONTAM: hypothetical protein Slati_3277200 [Sesamum latifolium]|uniref:Uncharacterized protein n=1 Tax=Sesamum latifolium TaxID=2727402 RepID=A0AAW2V0B2_9LAMI